MDSANLKKKFLNMAHGRSGHTTVNFVLGETVCIAFYELFTANDWESRDPVRYAHSSISFSYSTGNQFSKEPLYIPSCCGVLVR